MRVPCQGGCGKVVDLEAADAHKLYIALRRPNFHEAEVNVCSAECAMKAGMEMLASLIPAPDHQQARVIGADQLPTRT